ncbi:hypothetical protein IQ270_03055 [Microcoleus sp. LEGE 07076]|uniref:hypothetical protein n=1 Tax=Microcoleus sp. LEGE 07076 TaxID=915322 RepID=UPI001880087D|nr:hypothetical protein [Microcoleus sp. LEGE 07076]MBE9183729.1 hypothetical protein [Microcoleus sp. LEGE 07076]
MSNDDLQVRVQHFAALKSKYQATNYEDLSPSSLLYLILRKADLEFEITDFEWNWLQEQELLETIEAIEYEPQRRAEELRKLDTEFSQLKSKFKVTKRHDLRLSSPLYPILWKLDSEHQLIPSEVNYLKEQGLTQTLAIAQEMARFAALKDKYKATRYQDTFPENPLYKILNKLEAGEPLSDADSNWILTKELLETLDIYWQQEAVKEAEFSHLKAKYQVSSNQGGTFASSLLYPILQKIESEELLNEYEINWLVQEKRFEIVTLNQQRSEKREFAILKVKYNANQHEDSSISSPLYKVLQKLEESNPLEEEEVCWLQEQRLTDTLTIANEKYATFLKEKIKSGEDVNESEVKWIKLNDRKDILALLEQKHFAKLKAKYQFVDLRSEIPRETIYEIMLQLEEGTRLDRLMVAQLIVNDQLSPNGKIAKAHHTLEATFYEQEYKRTGNKWNLVSASSDWRKAKNPQKASELTNNFNFNKIPGDELKSALLTTRGTAFRDVENFSEAEKCAKQAIDYCPHGYEPYLLMATISKRQEKYEDYVFWENEAIKRGAELGDEDYELKRMVKNIKDEVKLQEVVEYLLKEDPHQYAWANSYLKQPKDKAK